MSNCQTQTYTNIKDLPQVFGVQDGDYLIIETNQGTNVLDFKDFVLPVANTTVGGVILNNTLDIQALSGNLISLSNAALPSIMNVRMSLSPTTSTPTFNISGSNASTLYVHPYKGDTITLYSTSLSAWKAYAITSILSKSLGDICTNSNTTYDIYISRENDGFVITSATLPSTVGNLDLTNYRAYQDGVAVKPGDKSKRLLGCVRTVAIGQSEQTFGATLSGGASPKQFVWNAQNQIPVSVYSLESGTWYLSSGIVSSGDSFAFTGWGKMHRTLNNGDNNKFSFIVGDYTQVNMLGQTYQNTGTTTGSLTVDWTHMVGYVGIGVDGQTVDAYQNISSMLIGEIRGESSTPRAQVLKSFEPGYHTMQLWDSYAIPVSNVTTGAVVYVQINENHTNECGFLASLTL